jgi:hypothetical protein
MTVFNRSIECFAIFTRRRCATMWLKAVRRAKPIPSLSWQIGENE